MKQAPAATQPVFRFAPSPNGLLHLGHACSALLNLSMARAAGGKMLLRIEDIDMLRCTPKLEAMLLDDLQWIGFEWDEAPRRQSLHFAQYEGAIAKLARDGLIYPSFASRSQMRALAGSLLEIGDAWPRDPDGAPFNPRAERALTAKDREQRISGGADFALRLDMAAALAKTSGPLRWRETGAGPHGSTGTVAANVEAWGDVVLWRKDAPASYHLACVLDDALQGVTNIIRGADLFHATSVHRLMQSLLKLPAPDYHHHGLIRSPDGRKLSKSRADKGLQFLREAGNSQSDIRRMIGLCED